MGSWGVWHMCSRELAGGGQSLKVHELGSPRGKRLYQVRRLPMCPGTFRRSPRPGPQIQGKGRDGEVTREGIRGWG